MDVEGFGDQRRTNPHQLAVREGLWQVLARGFDDAGVRWAGCRREDRGDGVLILAQAKVPKSRFVESLPGALVTALEEYNRACCAPERIRLRMAVHAGEVSYDRHGVAGAAVNLAFRLVEAPPLKAALARSAGVLAVIASSWFFEEVIRHSPASDPASYRPIRVAVKETSTVGWICLPGQPAPPGQPAASAVGPGVAVPRQLPAAVRHFVGRDAELAALAAQLAGAGQAGTVVISAVGGTAGIGKPNPGANTSDRYRLVCRSAVSGLRVSIVTTRLESARPGTRALTTPWHPSRPTDQMLGGLWYRRCPNQESRSARHFPWRTALHGSLGATPAPR